MSIEAALREVADEIVATVLERHEKYGPRNIAEAPGGPLNGLRVRLHDKAARINNVIDSDVRANFADDSFRDAWVDTVGYALIGLLVLGGKWPGGGAPFKGRLVTEFRKAPLDIR